MMSGICMSQNIDGLKRALQKGKLFSPSLKTTTLLMVFEILWNIGKDKSKCKQCFSKKTIRGLKQFKKLIRYFMKKSRRIEK